MKLHFKSDLDYQQLAIESVCDLFKGQEICKTLFTVTKSVGAQYGLFGKAGHEHDQGVGNRLQLIDTDLLKNLNEVQMRNGLPIDKDLRSNDFTVEMETGTGKTYVYLRTIFELNLRYGFTKFVIVVPSIAIKEGVYKTLEITREHFANLYNGVAYDYFLYDSSKPGQVRNFATSSLIQIMVTTVGAINKKEVNNLYKDNEKTGGDKPIDLIRSTRPILIVDEPQSVDGGLEGSGKKALGEMNPLCSLRYSATHLNKHHMVYKLDAVDAYEKKLVKQIEVAAATLSGDHNKAYVRIVSINAKPRLHAVIEVDKQSAHGVKRMEIKVSGSDPLDLLTSRELYEGYSIGEINATKGKSFVEIKTPQESVYLKVGEAIGQVDDLEFKRLLIRCTIQEHLEKEMRLTPLGIKVLSLFFIDSVFKYRSYDEQGVALKGDYACIFEEEYLRLIKHPRYNTLFEGADVKSLASEVHDGYFSIDKKGKVVDAEVNKEGELKNEANRECAERAYNLIMREKEKLLGFDTKLKFIFSHSALREGWDNPNVFQICNLRDMNSERERRQTIGRGLRLCVNQDGDRVPGFEVNTLTVIATESYEDFASKLQKEIEESTGIRFGIVEGHEFAGIKIEDASGVAAPFGIDASQELTAYLKSQGYVDIKGNIQDSLRQALKQGSLVLPQSFDAQKTSIEDILKKLSGKLDIKNADERKTVKPKKQVLASPEFKALWERISLKTTYRVDFDNEKLIANAAAKIFDAPPIAVTTLDWEKVGLGINRGGIEAQEIKGAGRLNKETQFVHDTGIPLPDLITDLQDRTQLTRKSIVDILRQSNRLQDFVKNPQVFIDVAVDCIVRIKQQLLVDGIQYQKIGNGEYYAQELIESKELSGYLKNLTPSQKCVYESVVSDSTIEETFANDLEMNLAVKLYMKLPDWFKIPTPLGSYNPDWAVLAEKNGEEQLYFVVETKGSRDQMDLRLSENAKIKCGKAHFKALAEQGGYVNPAKYVKATCVKDVMVEYVL